MSNDRLYIRCRCGGEPQMLAKIWGGRIGGDTAAWPQAGENLERFFEAHAGCAVENFALCFELEAAGLSDEDGPYTRAERASETRLPDRDGRVQGVDR